MTIEVFKKLGSKDQYEYLRDLEYQPCNLPNVGVHYGDVRAICISRESSAYVSEGSIKSYTCLLYTSPSPRDLSTSRMPSSA